MTQEKPALDDLIVSARSFAARQPGQEATRLLNDLCEEVERLRLQQEDARRDGFRDGIRGAAKVIRSRQAAPGSPLSDLISAEGADPDAFADELSKIVDVTPVTLNDLRKLRQKINAAAEGNDDIDDGLRRIYYFVMSERNPSSADVLPAGSPSRSLDVATFLVERVLRDGWWTLGNSGTNSSDKPMAKVGLSDLQDSKPHTAETTVLALLGGLVLALIEASKSSAR